MKSYDVKARACFGFSFPIDAATREEAEEQARAYLGRITGRDLIRHLDESGSLDAVELVEVVEVEEGNDG